MIRSDACSVLAQGEPLAGSAPFARAWLIVEHPGPWGRDALTESGLPEAVVHHINAAASTSPIRFLAARRMDRRRSKDTIPASRRVWLAHVVPERARTRSVVITSLEQILEWDLSALTTGDFPVDGELVNQPMEFVCTHSRRDTCCAVLGRERVGQAPPSVRGQVWECSHLGGHRFAATSLFLPSGRLYGRLPGHVSIQGEMLSEPSPDHLRGPSYLTAPLQAAECAARMDGSLSPSDTVRVEAREPGEESILASVVSIDGRRWLVRCDKGVVTSPASCGEAARDRPIWRTHIIERSF